MGTPLHDTKMLTEIPLLLQLPTLIVMEIRPPAIKMPMETQSVIQVHTPTAMAIRLLVTRTLMEIPSVLQVLIRIATAIRLLVTRMLTEIQRALQPLILISMVRQQLVTKTPMGIQQAPQLPIGDKSDIIKTNQSNLLIMRIINIIFTVALTMYMYGCGSPISDNSKDVQKSTLNDDYSIDESTYSGDYNCAEEDGYVDDVEAEEYDEELESQELARQGDMAYYEVMDLIATYEYRFEHASSKYELEREMADFADDFAEFSNKYTDFSLTPSQDADISSAFQEIGFLFGQRYAELGATKSDIEYIQRKYFQL